MTRDEDTKLGWERGRTRLTRTALPPDFARVASRTGSDYGVDLRLNPARRRRRALCRSDVGWLGGCGVNDERQLPRYISSRPAIGPNLVPTPGRVGMGLQTRYLLPPFQGGNKGSHRCASERKYARPRGSLDMRRIGPSVVPDVRRVLVRPANDALLTAFAGRRRSGPCQCRHPRSDCEVSRFGGAHGREDNSLQAWPALTGSGPLWSGSEGVLISRCRASRHRVYRAPDLVRAM